MIDHDPERDAAAYVDGQLASDERRAFERHLLECETCWTEVRLDREGRRLAEAGRDVAPVDLRERVRAAVTSVEPAEERVRPPSRRRGRTAAVPILAAAAVLLAIVASAAILRTGGDPGSIMAAVAMHDDGGIERAHTGGSMPELAPFGLEPMGDEELMIDDLEVHAFAYRAAGGGRLTLFMASDAFPRPEGAAPMPDGGWQTMRGDLGLASAPLESGASFLLVTDDPTLLHDVPEGIAEGSVVLQV
jgi:hypothetical protein